MNKSAGSYDFQDISKREDELVRLNRQAQIAISLEKNIGINLDSPQGNQ